MNLSDIRFCRSAKSAVMYTLAGPYQTVREQREPEQFYSFSTPTVSYLQNVPVHIELLEFGLFHRPVF
jgi:hypothetical protein